MIRVPPVPEPSGFAAAQAKGEAWLRKNPAPTEKRAPDHWSKFRPVLEEGFGQRCGYTAMYLSEGTVDHYHCQNEHRDLTYTWSNYRFCSNSINSRKKCKDMLDPYTIGDDWFEIQYPSLQLLLTEAIPKKERERALRTIIELRLRDSDRILKRRRMWFEEYKSGKLSLEGLEGFAPLIAAMVKREGL